jgi:hypothetical protein
MGMIVKLPPKWETRSPCASHGSLLSRPSRKGRQWLKSTIFWDVKLSNLVEVHWHFAGAHIAACFSFSLLFDLKDGGIMFLQNISELLLDYMVRHIPDDNILYSHHCEKLNANRKLPDFEVIMAVIMKCSIFWDMMPCNLVDIICFGGNRFSPRLSLSPQIFIYFDPWEREKRKGCSFSLTISCLQWSSKGCFFSPFHFLPALFSLRRPHEWQVSRWRSDG